MDSECSGGIVEVDVNTQSDCCDVNAIELRKVSMGELLQEITVVVNSAYQVCRKYKSDLIVQENALVDPYPQHPSTNETGYEPWEEELKTLIESSGIKGLSEYHNLDEKLYDIIDASINYIIDNASE